MVDRDAPGRSHRRIRERRARRAIEAIGGERLPSGDYTVVFGRQPVADLMNNLVVPSCEVGAFYSSSTPFLGKLGKPVASPRLSVYDQGALPGLMGSKGITCEGLPTGRTDLIKDGVLTGALTSWYEAQRLLHDPAIKEKLGVEAAARRAALVARNGFRFSRAAGAPSTPSPRPPPPTSSSKAPTRLDRRADPRRAPRPLRRPHLVHVPDQRAPRGRLHVHRGGRLLHHPRRPARRAAQGQHRAHQRQHHAAARERRRRHQGCEGTVVWGADEVVYAPEIAVTGVRVDAIAGFMGD